MYKEKRDLINIAEESNSLICPNCYTLDIIKTFSKSKLQGFICKECGTTFYIPQFPKDKYGYKTSFNPDYWKEQNKEIITFRCSKKKKVVRLAKEGGKSINIIMDRIVDYYFNVLDSFEEPVKLKRQKSN